MSYVSYLLIIPLICSHFSRQCLCCPRTAPPVRTPPGPQSRGLTQDTLQSPDRGHVTLVTQWHPPNVAATDQNTPDTLSHPAHSPVSEAPGSHSPASHSVLMLTESSPQLLPSLQFSLAPPACWLDSWGPAVVESGAVINLKSRPINPPGQQHRSGIIFCPDICLQGQFLRSLKFLDVVLPAARGQGEGVTISRLLTDLRSRTPNSGARITNNVLTNILRFKL